MQFTTIFATLVSVATLVAGAPVVEEKRDVYVPPVTYPTAGAVWTSGQKINVTWDNSDPPASISNRASIRLRKDGLITPFILAKDFDLRAGSVEVTVPLVVEGEYSLVLFGDSGNNSPDFQITGSGFQF